MLFRIKTAADVPDETEFIAFIQTQQQGTKWNRWRARRGPAADNGIERLCHLQLQPIHAAIGNVPTVGSLRDDAFQAAFLREREEFFSVFPLVIRIAKAFRHKQQPLKKLLPLEQRRFTKIVSIAVKKIEHIENGWRFRKESFARGAHVHAFLQAPKVAVASLIQGHNFSVQNG